MKKIYIIIALLAFTALSCKESFIDLTPTDSYSASSFYKNETQFRQALNAAYVPLRDLLVNDFYTAEMRTDNSKYEPYPTNRGTATVYRENISDFTDTPVNSYTNAVYFHCYSCISKTNVVIERLAKAENITAAAKADIDGQAKFLRAWNYFKLVRYFGGVPLFLKEVTKADDAFLPRSTAEEIYAQIISDATDAINELAKPAKFPQSGQATKGSATMLLAEVYMTQKKYAEAETLLLTLPAMGYGLNTNYADAFLTTNKNSKESLFEVQYMEGTAVGTAPSTFIYLFMVRTNSSALITGTATNTGGGGWNIPTQDMIDAYEPNDKRKDVSIGIAEGVYNASWLMVISANKSVINYTPAAGKTGVPYVKKYLHLPHVAVNNSNDNWPIYRYADALLLLAEAQNEQGKSAAALVNLNLVRVRAGLTASTQTDQALLRDIIAHERRVELAFENHRWHDLVRTGKAVSVMNAFGAKLKLTDSYYLPLDAYNVTNDKLLYPIPQSERELNPALTQNPGYY